MSWLTDKLKHIMGKPEPKPAESEFPYGETQGLIGEAVTEYVPESAVVEGSIIDIVLITSPVPQRQQRYV